MIDKCATLEELFLRLADDGRYMSASFVMPTLLNIMGKRIFMLVLDDDRAEWILYSPDNPMGQIALSLLCPPGISANDIVIVSALNSAHFEYGVYIGGVPPDSDSDLLQTGQVAASHSTLVVEDDCHVNDNLSSMSIGGNDSHKRTIQKPINVDEAKRAKKSAEIQFIEINAMLI